MAFEAQELFGTGLELVAQPNPGDPGGADVEALEPQLVDGPLSAVTAAAPGIR